MVFGSPGHSKESCICILNFYKMKMWQQLRKFFWVSMACNCVPIVFYLWLFYSWLAFPLIAQNVPRVFISRSRHTQSALCTRLFLTKEIDFHKSKISNFLISVQLWAATPISSGIILPSSMPLVEIACISCL